MALDIQRLLSDQNIDFKTSGPQVTRGWVNMQCPFCGDTKWHLGYSQKLDIFTCWKCGIKNKEWTLSKILNIPISEVKELLKDYFVKGSYENDNLKKKSKELILPDNYGKLTKPHKLYLKKRGFDFKKLRKDYQIISATENSKDYSNRILIPIYYKGQLVSYHSRTNFKSRVKAKACEEDNEIIKHKNLIYNFDNLNSNTVIVSEGPFDAWRWGCDVGTCLWGIKFTEHQVDLLSCFKNIFLVFDSKIVDEKEEEIIAQKQADRLADMLGIWNNVWVISELGCDPADLSQREADKIKSKMLKMTKEK